MGIRWVGPGTAVAVSQIGMLYALILMAAGATCPPELTAVRTDALGLAIRAITGATATVSPGRTLVREDELADTSTYVERCVEEHYSWFTFVPSRMRYEDCCGSTSGTYGLYFSDGRVVLQKELILLYQGDPDEEARVRAKTEDARRVLESVFDAHGIELDLRLTFIGSLSWVPLDWLSVMFLHDVIAVYDEVPRGQVRPYSNQMVLPHWQPDRIALGIVLHEFSHTIGLPDGYSDNVNCPRRALLEPGHVVTAGQVLEYGEDGEVLNFFAADHIRALLRPLCGD